MIPFIDIHTHNCLNAGGLSIINAKVFDDLGNEQYCVGLHPWDIDKVNPDEVWLWMKHGIENSKIVAIGECGLDRAICTSLDQQLGIFKKQIDLANQYQKPLIIHCVRAWSDILSIRKGCKTASTWIYHGFNSSEIIARQIIETGAYVSFGKALLESEKLQAVFQKISLASIFFETDNATIKIEAIYKIAAKIRHICIEELKEQIFDNYAKVFGK